MPTPNYFLANNTFEDWKSDGNTDETSNAGTLEIRLRVFNPKFATFSVYDHERIGAGHGMYTETFHTLDLSNGNSLSNRDIFKADAMGKVKKLLYETMFNDKRYRDWNQGLESPEEIEAGIEDWQSPNPILEGTIWEEPKCGSSFEIHDGALLNSGVVFSFQPYNIGCWAEGAYHFIVPYDKLRPYLTT